MEPRAVAEAVETGKEDVIMEALRSYNQEWLLPELEANRPPPSADADPTPLWI
uniref:RIC8 guanine nucleotide exchange factor A n=1 Tax=Nomascus leucogenys TaxID=61853 RepID=A0A2I3G3L4_NOMLE